MYKLDNLFRSIRVSDENSSVTSAIQFFEITWTRDFLCVQNAPFKATSSILKPFWLHLLFFMHLLIFLSYMTLKMKSYTNELSKGWKLAGYHHFTHIECAKKLRGLRRNMDALRVQNEQSLSKYLAFGGEFICYTGTSMFVKLFWTPAYFCVQYASFKATSSISNTFWHHVLFFSHLPICLES